jgi:hypothetical protein
VMVMMIGGGLVSVALGGALAISFLFFFLPDFLRF